MKLTELIGKKITDILVTTQRYDEFKDQGLWKADCYIVLQDGLIVGIPFDLENDDVWIRDLDHSAISYYQRKWWQRKVDASSDLRGTKIADVISYPDSTEKALFELDNGKIITEVTVAPMGIAVGLYVYQSIAEVEKKIWIRLHKVNQPEKGSLTNTQHIMKTTNDATYFAPELHIPNGTFNIDFYFKFGAMEHFCFRNDDGSIHVAELEFNGAFFHVHETMRDALEPISAKGVTAVIGLFVPDVAKVMQQAIQAGAIEINPVTDHDYGYRQGMFKDPFGHYWQIQKKI